MDVDGMQTGAKPEDKGKAVRLQDMRDSLMDKEAEIRQKRLNKEVAFHRQKGP